MKLERLVECLNVDLPPLQCTETAASFFAEETRRCFERQFLQTRSPNKDLRVSGLGKPAVLQALQLLGYDTDSEISTSLRHIFFTGDLFESYATTMLGLLGVPVYDTQKEVNFDGVLGHIDGVISTDDGDFVLEVKTMSQTYFRTFVKEQNDDRGYLTQAAVYSHCIGLPLVWLCLNKSTHEVRFVRADQTDLDKALERVRQVLPRLREIQKSGSLETMVKLVRCPPAVEETLRREPTGKYLLPPAMQYSKWRSAFYDTETVLKYGKPVEYVTGYASPEEVILRVQELAKCDVNEEEFLL